MNVMIYCAKKNPDVLKAERFFKERRVPYQLVDLKKHRLGRRELELFARGRGVKGIINMEDEGVRSHPIAYAPNEQVMLDYLMENPQFLISPIIRSGQKIVVGFEETAVQGLAAD